jgi:hypothetical protein
MLSQEINAMDYLTTLSKKIRIQDGLFSLNDLHKVSGGNQKHAPFRFIRNIQTKALIAKIEQTPDLVLAYKSSHGGKNSGTWVCKELVYAYAMWISAEFYLRVIRIFDQQQASGSQVAVVQQSEYISVLEQKIIQYEKKMRLIHSHTTGMKKEFADTVFPALKALNSRLYGNAYERLHVVHMSSKVY